MNEGMKAGKGTRRKRQHKKDYQKRKGSRAGIRRDRMNKKKYDTMEEQWTGMSCGNEMWEERDI